MPPTGKWRRSSSARRGARCARPRRTRARPGRAARSRAMRSSIAGVFRLVEPDSRRVLGLDAHREQPDVVGRGPELLEHGADAAQVVSRGERARDVLRDGVHGVHATGLGKPGGHGGPGFADVAAQVLVGRERDARRRGSVRHRTVPTPMEASPSLTAPSSSPSSAIRVMRTVTSSPSRARASASSDTSSTGMPWA